MAKIENEWLRQDLQEIAVCDVYLYDAASGLEYGTTTLETSELTSKTSSEDIVGGVDGNVITTIDKSKTLELKIGEICSRQDLQMLRLGTPIKAVGTDLVDAYHMPHNYTVKTETTDLIVTLDQTPKAGEVVAVYNNKTGKLIDPTKAVLSGNKITITESDIVAGDTVYITGFKYSAKATDKYAEISNSSTTPALVAVTNVPLFDADMNIIAQKQYIFPRVKISGDVTISGNSEKKKVTDTMTLKILKDKSLDYLGRIVWIYPTV